MRIFRHILLPFAIAPLVVACAGGLTPQDTLRDYRSAVESDDVERAYSLLSPDARASITRERFDVEFERRVESATVISEQLEFATRSDASLHANLPYSRYETLELGFIDGSWRIIGGVANFYGQDSPRDALVSFIRAVEANDAQQLLALVPAEYRALMAEPEMQGWLERRSVELAEIVALLEANIGTPITESGDSAIFRYGTREMQFVREGGRWVIADFE